MHGRRFAGSLALLVAAAFMGAGNGMARAEEAAIPDAPLANRLQLELGLFGGVHFFASNLELGVADGPGVPHPKTGAEFGLRAAATLLPWLSIEGELAGIPSADSIHNYSLFLMTYKLHALVHLMHGPVRPFVLAGIGWMQVASHQPDPGPTEIGPDTDFDFHAGVGIKYAVTNKIDLRADARVVFLPNTGHNTDSADVELLGGATMRFGGEARAPAEPPAPLVGDRDRDDIPDSVDKCPDQAEDKDGFQDEDGCPDPDNDADGIPDATDKCPNEAEDKDGFQDEDGCPDPDNDGDGVLDANDKCPKELETRNGYKDEDGCPDEVPAAVKKFTGVIKGITFKVKSADIQKSSFKMLNDAVKVMKEYAELRIEISGHTSSEGVAEKNQKLSEDRAASVKAYMVAQGIAENRIVAVGYGSDKPIGLNSTPKGREQNRRIEFRLLSGSDAPAGGAPAPAPGASGAGAAGAPKAGAAPAPKLPPAGEPMPPK